MIWLASFPRSGNTFLRNVLYEVYGLESSTFHREEAYPLDAGYAGFPIVKTHLLPIELEPWEPDIPAVYLIRDGRDALVSLAHHKKDIIDPGSNYYDNLNEAIIAAEGSYFGGWSENVAKWMKRADLIIRFEDLIKNPVECAERLRSVMDLPEPKVERLPTFEKLKSGNPQYGSGKSFTDTPQDSLELSRLNFRKGKAGAWKEEMPEELHDLFWNYHGQMMEMTGYGRDGSIQPLRNDLDGMLKYKLGEQIGEPERKYRILIESTKLVEEKSDGIKRYVFELLHSMVPATGHPYTEWDIDLFIDGNIYSLWDYQEQLNIEIAALQRKLLFYEKVLLGFKYLITFMIPKRSYETLAEYYRKLDVRRQLAFIKSRIVSSRSKRKLKKGEKLKKDNDEFYDYDLIHLTLPQNYEPFVGSNPKFVTTVHDLTHSLFPQFHLQRNIELSEMGFGFISNYNHGIIAVSGSTANDLEKHGHIENNKIKMIHEAADRSRFKLQFNPHLAALIRKKYKIPDGRFYLCLSTIEPRKNLINTIKAFQHFKKRSRLSDFYLIIGGKMGWKQDNVAEEPSWDDPYIRFTGFVDEIDLPILYHEAEALCYLSYYEGFGLPALEAMSCGTPVLYSDVSSLPEIIGDGGIAVKPGDINKISEGMIRFSDAQFRKEKANLALKQSSRFSWRKTAESTLDFYREIITGI